MSPGIKAEVAYHFSLIQELPQHEQQMLVLRCNSHNNDDINEAVQSIKILAKKFGSERLTAFVNNHFQCHFAEYILINPNGSAIATASRIRRNVRAKLEPFDLPS
jgi:hypothetical protein